MQSAAGLCWNCLMTKSEPSPIARVIFVCPRLLRAG